jgi:hypothetical protein
VYIRGLSTNPGTNDASLEAIREEWRESVRLGPVHPSMIFTADGLVLGAGTVLAKANLDQCDRPEATLNEVEERVVALLLRPTAQ